MATNNALNNIGVTQSPGDNTTNLATTAFVTSAVSGTSGALTFIASVTASASATVNFDNKLTSTYDNYLIVMENVVASVNQSTLQMDVGTGGTPTYQTSNYAGTNTGSCSAGSGHTGNSSTSTFSMTGTSVGATITVSNVSTNSIGGNICVTNTQNASNWKCFNSHVGGILVDFTGPNVGSGQILAGGNWKVATALTSLRFKMDSGNVTTGTFKLYGIQN